MEKRQRIEEALKEIGIHSIKDLNEAIKKEKPLDLGIMVGDAEAVRKAGEEVKRVERHRSRKEQSNGYMQKGRSSCT